MKKLLLLLAMAVMVIGLVAGCGKSADNGGDKKSDVKIDAISGKFLSAKVKTTKY